MFTCNIGTVIRISISRDLHTASLSHLILYMNFLRLRNSPAEVRLSSRDTFCLGLDIRNARRSAVLQQDDLSVLVNYRR
jgi:hypothetical protein